ncbi:MAG: sel1 repeat family protein, partial [Hellea sp.]|nr:sel1 repeat family protein [Hellea sp.]
VLLGVSANAQESAEEQFYMGVAFEFGKGVPENDAEAFKWYRLAAEQGHAMAQSNLGVMYSIDKGVPENDAEAFKWYRMAAEQGHAGAQFKLAYQYGTGAGVPENFVKGYAWNSLAAAQGHKTAQDNKSVFVDMMTREQIADAQTLAARCFESDYRDCD